MEPYILVIESATISSTPNRKSSPATMDCSGSGSFPSSASISRASPVRMAFWTSRFFTTASTLFRHSSSGSES